MRDTTVKGFVFIFPVAFIAVMAYMKIAHNEIYRGSLEEEGFIERAQGWVYFACSGAALYVAIRFLKNRLKIMSGFYFLLTLVFLFICFEEISWGQRFFNLTTPDFFEKHNVQKEISVHNLRSIHPHLTLGYILIGLAGAFAWIIVPREWGRRHEAVVRYFIPRCYLMLYFLPVSLVYMVLFGYVCGFLLRVFGVDNFNHDFLTYTDQEPAELLLALGALLFLGSHVRRRNA